MAHGREGPDLVMNIRYVGTPEIAHVSRHELHRTPDGTSAIDPARSHLNRVLVGPRTQGEAIAGMIASGVRPPTAQAESPFVQLVLSASPAFFRSEGQEPGEWDECRMRDWTARSLRWLRREHGRDLAHVALHLDEDTPHLHVLIVPTYERAARRPGRMKRGETPEGFEARKAAAAAAPTVRTIGRASSEKWGDGWSKLTARKSYHAAVEPLGLGYGRDFVGAGDPSPVPTPTGAWVRQEAARVRRETHAIRRIAAGDVALLPDNPDLIDGPGSVIDSLSDNLALTVAAFDLATTRRQAESDRAAAAAARAEAEDARAAIIIERQKLADELSAAQAKRARAEFAEIAAEAERTALAEDRRIASGLIESLREIMGRMRVWLRRPDLPRRARAEAEAIMSEPSVRELSPPDAREEPSEDTRPGF